MSQLLPERRSRFSPTRWEPFSDLDQVTERMRRMLEQTFGGDSWPGESGAGQWSPLVDVEETEEAYVIEAELPGVKREDVDVELLGGDLRISGELKEEREREGTMRRKMRRSGRFDYRLRLPEPVDAEKIDAKLADGVLQLKVPKSERAQRRKIEIASA